MPLKILDRIRAVFFFLVVVAHPTPSQTFIFDTYNVGHGLPSNWITTICQDPKGYLWVGGDGGIAVYNGVSFTAYGAGDGLSVPMIWKLTASLTSPGAVYIGTYGGGPGALRQSGLRKINNGTFTTVSTTSDEIPHAVFEIVEDRNGVVWYGTSRGLYRSFNDSASFFPLGKDSGLVQLLYELRDGSLLIGTGSSLYTFTSNDGKGDITQLHKTESAHVYTCVVEDAEGVLWLGTSTGEIVRIAGGETAASRKTPANYMSDVALDKDGNLWFATTEGLIKMQTRDFRQAQILHYTLENGLPALDLTTCYIDREDNLWLGSRSTGLSKLPYRNIIKFQIDDLHPQVFGNSVAVTEDGRLFTITEQNLWEMWHDEAGNWRSFPHTIHHVVKGPALRGQLIGGMSAGIAQDGTLWVAFRWGGLRNYRVSPRKGTHSALTPLSTLRPGIEIPHGSATGIQIDKDMLWYNIRGGPLTLIDLSTLSVRDTFRLSHGTMQALLTTRADSVWVGAFNDGISILAPKGDTFKLVRVLTAENGLASNRIRSIIQRRNGDIWIGTRFDGIIIYRNGTFRSMGPEYGLLNPAVWKITEDDEGRAWVGTSVGLQYTNPDGDQLHTHPRLSGRQVGGIGIDAARKRLWMTSEGELAVYEYGSEQRMKAPPLIEVVGLRVNGKDRNLDDELILSHNENFCVIRFTGLSFRDEGGLHHRYRLIGLDTTWSEPTSQRVVTFGSLRSGKYKFEVHALTADGTQSIHPASLSFVILPPWYLSPWTIGLYVLSGAIFVFLYIRFRTRKLERRSRELEQLVTERTEEVVQQRNRLKEQAEHLQVLDIQKSRFFANISHEFRTPLTVILGHLDRLMGTEDGKLVKDYPIMERNARRLLHFINQLLDLSKIEAGGMTLRAANSDIVSFVKRTVGSLSSYAHHKGISLTFNGASPDTPGHSPVFAYFDHDKIEKVLVNLISNALKFTPHGGAVDVTLSSGGLMVGGIHCVQISVTDTGTGIPAAKLPYVFDRFYQVEDYARPGYEGTGIGLALVKELVELHHGSVSVRSVEGRGTAFTVQLPLGTAHLDEGEIVETETEEIARDLRAAPDVDSPTPPPHIETESDDARVLIVEDNTDLRNFIRDQLSAEFTVIEASDGIQGLRFAAEFMPDIVISDIMMPEMDGYELCRKVKSNQTTNHIPVILLTAKATTENKLAGLELGADDYLMKPFNTQELQIRVRNLIQTRRQLREKFSSEMLLKPAEVTVPSQQKLFLERVTGIIERHLAEEEFSVETLAGEAGMSRSQLHRKLKALTNKGPNELIRSFRLQRAAELIRQDAGSLAEIAYQVGFGSQAHFSRSFSEEFGMSPSDYKKSSIPPSSDTPA